MEQSCHCCVHAQCVSWGRVALTALSASENTTNDLIGLREIARCLESGMLSEKEAVTAVSRRFPQFSGAFTDMATAAAVIEMIDAILQARSPAARLLTRSERYRFKAVECLQLADNARHSDPRETYTGLAACYEKLARQAEALEKERYEALTRRTGLKL